MDSNLKNKLDRIRLEREIEEEIKTLETELGYIHSAREGERRPLEKTLIIKKELLEALLKDRGKIRKEKDDQGLLVNLNLQDK